MSLGGGDSEGDPGSRSEVVMSLGSGVRRDEESGYDDALGELSWDILYADGN